MFTLMSFLMSLVVDWIVIVILKDKGVKKVLRILLCAFLVALEVIAIYTAVLLDKFVLFELNS